MSDSYKLPDQYKLNDLFFEADELIKQNRISESQKLLEEILEMEPGHAKAHNHLGWIFETKLKDFARAEVHYKQANASDPAYDAVYYNYAILLSTHRRWKELETLLNKALGLSHINRSTIYNEFGIMHEMQGNFNEAISAYKEAVKNSLDAKNITIYKDSILRCKQKQEIDNI